MEWDKGARGNQWLLALSEMNQKMAATFAVPALKKRKEKKGRTRRTR